MLGFSPLSQGPIGTSGADAGVSVAINVSGVSATGQVGSVTVSLGVSVSPNGLQGTGQVGSVTPSIPAVVILSGWGFGAWNQNSWGVNATQPEATGAVGTVDIHNDMSVRCYRC